jgi:hypothetical protein
MKRKPLSAGLLLSLHCHCPEFTMRCHSDKGVSDMERRSFLKSALTGSAAVVITPFTQPAMAKAERVEKQLPKPTKRRATMPNIL